MAAGALGYKMERMKRERPMSLECSESTYARHRHIKVVYKFVAKHSWIQAKPEASEQSKS